MHSTHSGPTGAASHDLPPVPPTFSQALAYWWRLGCLSFGGPAGQIALMHEDLVVRRRWISERRFLHALNYCMVLPGPEAQQLATYIGWLMHRTWGGLAAGGLFVLPSWFLLMGLSWCCLAWGHVPAVAGALHGIKPAVTALVVSAALRIGQRTLKHPALWVMALGAFLALSVGGWPFPLIVLLAGVCGALGGRWAPDWFVPGGGHGAAARPLGPALIDDDTPVPPHARFQWSRAWWVLGTCLALWGVVMGALVGLYGWQGTLSQMAWFFTKAALLTFGGAYAVLPYVHQGAVDHFHWLSAAQMMDGLALGETTPGPLIMVVSYVGFVGGWNQAVLGPDALLAGAVLASTVVTFFTFLPSFLFIFLGAPFIESTHGQLRFTAPLTGISAAVVGVIASLALFFASHVLWPQGWGGPFDAVALAIGLAAGVALVRFNVGVIRVVLASALAGWLWQLVGA